MRQWLMETLCFFTSLSQTASIWAHSKENQIYARKGDGRKEDPQLASTDKIIKYLCWVFSSRPWSRTRRSLCFGKLSTLAVIPLWLTSFFVWRGRNKTNAPGVAVGAAVSAVWEQTQRNFVWSILLARGHERDTNVGTIERFGHLPKFKNLTHPPDTDDLKKKEKKNSKMKTSEKSNFTLRSGESGDVLLSCGPVRNPRPSGAFLSLKTQVTASTVVCDAERVVTTPLIWAFQQGVAFVCCALFFLSSLFFTTFYIVYSISCVLSKQDKMSSINNQVEWNCLTAKPVE